MGSIFPLASASLLVLLLAPSRGLAEFSVVRRLTSSHPKAKDSQTVVDARPILKPDSPSEPTFPDTQPQESLESWLKKRRKDPNRKQHGIEDTEQLQDGPTLKKIVDKVPPITDVQADQANVHVGLGLIIPQLRFIRATEGHAVLEPGPLLSLLSRISDSPGSLRPSVWWGLRVASFSGSAYLSEEFQRFAWTAIGPQLTLEWLKILPQSADGLPRGSSRLQISLAGSLLSRQSPRGSESNNRLLRTQALSTYGGGVVLEGTYARSLFPQLDWQALFGIQASKQILLSYWGLGICLWST